MIEDISEKIAFLEKNPKILNNIFRGIERETLRIKKNGSFSEKKHPYLLGSPLTHKWITTDFSENLLEFITPTSNNIDYLLSFLKDLHCFTASKTQNELIWPFSMPYDDNKTDIQIAQYGNSNLGKMKTTYRIGLKHRYGDLVNTVSGVHYNFSLPLIFWKNCKKNISKKNKNTDYVSSGYLDLIRNYYRFGWIIPYLFGASPAISSSFLKNTKKKYRFKKTKENILYLPWSTSLRLSDIGYTNSKVIDLNIMFNDLNSYIQSLKKSIETPSKKFMNIGLKDIYGNFKQLNTNILQMESELYTQIRPKRKINYGETLIESLTNKGIEYVEIRSLDINPFSPIGISKKQILFLDLFLIWCALIDSPQINTIDVYLINKNWKKIIFEGRKPNQKIYLNNKYEKKTLVEISDIIFKDLHQIALILDYNSKNFTYQKICKETKLLFYNPELTYSAKFLKIIIETGIKKAGLYFANKYHRNFTNKNYLNLNKNILEQEVIRSHEETVEIEKTDMLSFEEYIKQLNSSHASKHGIIKR